MKIFKYQITKIKKFKNVKKRKYQTWCHRFVFISHLESSVSDCNWFQTQSAFLWISCNCAREYKIWIRLQTKKNEKRLNVYINTRFREFQLQPRKFLPIVQGRRIRFLSLVFQQLFNIMLILISYINEA